MATPRLPTPGSDNGTWGNLLNDFLSESHAADGTLKPDTVGTSQIQDAAVTSDQLDAPTKSAVTKASSSVQTINSKTPTNGAVTLTASDVGAVDTVMLGAANGVATLDGSNKLLAGQVPNLSGTYVAPKGVRRELAARNSIVIAASPPTIVLSAANAATSITGSSLRVPQRVNSANNTSTEPIDLANDVNYSYLGVGQGQYVWGFGNTKTVNLTGTLSSKHWSYSVESNIYCDAFEIVFVPANAIFSYRLRVDGQFVTEYATTLTGLTIGATYRLLVTFSAIGNRKIRLDLADNGLTGLALKPIHSTSRVNEAPDIPTYIGAADSVTAGTNTDGSANGFCRIDSWINYTAELLGWRDLHNGALASTGFVNAGTESAFTARLADIAVPGARIITYGGLNDVASVATTMPAAIDTVFSAIVAAGPAEFIVFGCHPMQLSTYTNAGYTNVNNLLKSKAAQYGATFIDPFVVHWVTSTSTTSAPTGGGNGDLFVATDAIHPNREGHKYLGRLYADAYVATMANLAA